MPQAFLPNLSSLHLEPTGADRAGGKRPMKREDDSRWRRKSASAKDVPLDFGMRQLNALVEEATRGGQQRLTKEQVEKLIDKVLLWFLEEEDWVMDFVFYNIHLTRAVEQVLTDLLERGRVVGAFNRGHITELLLPMLHKGSGEQAHDRAQGRARDAFRALRRWKAQRDALRAPPPPPSPPLPLMPGIPMAQSETWPSPPQESDDEAGPSCGCGGGGDEEESHLPDEAEDHYYDEYAGEEEDHTWGVPGGGEGQNPDGSQSASE